MIRLKKAHFLAKVLWIRWSVSVKLPSTSCHGLYSSIYTCRIDGESFTRKKEKKKRQAGKYCIFANFQGWMRENWLVLTVRMSFSICSSPEPAFAECLGCLSASSACVPLFRRVWMIQISAARSGAKELMLPKVIPNVHGCISLLSTVFTASPGNGTGLEFWIWPELQTNLPLHLRLGREKAHVWREKKKEETMQFKWLVALIKIPVQSLPNACWTVDAKV